MRAWQLGIEMRPFFNRESLWVWPLFGGIGGSFGYWMNGVESRQRNLLVERRDSLMAKRRRRAEREGTSVEENIEKGGLHQSPVGMGPSGGRDMI